MRTFSVNIGERNISLDAYLHDKLKDRKEYDLRPCVIVCPGGGYFFRSDREADPVVFEWLARGYQVFLLNYSVAEHAGNYQPVKELSEAVVTIRKNAAQWGVRKDNIAVIGFSAGAHLALSLGVFYHSDRIQQKEEWNRPDALILCYPVVTAGEYAHEGSFENLTGQKRCEEWDAFSLEKYIGKEVPPCFIWHTVDDAVVPVENSLLLINALQKAKVSYEAHIFPHGAHGLSMCTGEVRRDNGTIDQHTGAWFSLCAEWLAQQFGFIK